MEAIDVRGQSRDVVGQGKKFCLLTSKRYVRVRSQAVGAFRSFLNFLDRGGQPVHLCGRVGHGLSNLLDRVHVLFHQLPEQSDSNRIRHDHGGHVFQRECSMRSSGVIWCDGNVTRGGRCSGGIDWVSVVGSGGTDWGSIVRSSCNCRNSGNIASVVQWDNGVPIRWREVRWREEYITRLARAIVCRVIVCGRQRSELIGSFEGVGGLR